MFALEFLANGQLTTDPTGVNFPAEVSPLPGMLEEYQGIVERHYLDMRDLDSQREVLLSRTQDTGRKLHEIQQTSDCTVRLRSELNESTRRLIEIETEHLKSQGVYASDRRKLVSELEYIEKAYSGLQAKLASRLQEVAVPSTINAKEARNSHWLDLVGVEYESPIIHN